MVTEEKLEELFEELLIKDCPWEGRLFLRGDEFNRFREKFDNYNGVFYYPACGRDFTPLFASRHQVAVYQDKGVFAFEENMPMDKEFEFLFKRLRDKGLARNLEIKRKRFSDKMIINVELRELEDSSDKFHKKIIKLFFGKKYGDMRTYLPKIVKEATLVYTRNMHICPEMLTYLRPGTIISSSTTIDSKGYFDPVPDEQIRSVLGLNVMDMDDGIFEKY